MSPDTRFPEGTSDATTAAYFRQGLFAEVFSIEAPKDWAYEMIRLRESPSIELIEIATTNQLREMETLLARLLPDADLELAARWLFKDVLQRLESDEWPLRRAIRQTMEIAWPIEALERIVWYCDGLIEGIDLAERRTWGEVAEIRRDTIDFLQSECRDRHQEHLR